MIGTNTTRNQTPHRLCLPFIAARLHGGVGSASVLWIIASVLDYIETAGK